MKELQKLSVNRDLVFDFKKDDVLEITCVDEKNTALATVKCTKLKLNEFVLDWFYSEILHPELNYFFYELLNKEERLHADSMTLSGYVDYLNNKFKETDTATMNGLYNIYNQLNEYISSNIFNREIKCILLNSIDSFEEDNDGLSLILDNLKEDYELITTICNEEIEDFLLEKSNFKELINSNVYWSSNEKLNDIL